MHSILLTAILLMFTLEVGYAETLGKPDAKLGEGMTVPGAIEQPAWFKNSFLDIAEDVREAKAANKRLMLYFYQDGCPYCKKLIQTNFAIKALADKAQSSLDVVSINMWGDREVIDVDGERLNEKRFAAKMRVMFTPTLIFFDEQAEVALRVNGYYDPRRFDTVLDYIGQRMEKKIAYREYAAQRLQGENAGHKGMRKEKYFLKSPLKLDVKRSGDKPLAVLFEQQDCPPCEELHVDVLPRKETQTLVQQFDIAQIDMWSNDTLISPRGEKLAAREWAKALDVKYAPTLVLFDAQGQEVFRTEAYLKSFHIQSALEYVATGAYKSEPSFQRFVEARADGLRKKGIKVELMN